VIQVGPLPTFLVGVNEAVTRWRQDFKFAETKIPSIFNKFHSNSFMMTNHFSRGTSVVASLAMPEAWIVTPAQVGFSMAHREQLLQPFQIKLPYSASSGRHDVRVDFLVRGRHDYRFSVYRKIDIGLGDVYIEVATRLTDDGMLEVEQRLVNETDEPVQFRCSLYAPDHPRQRTDITAAARGSDAQLYWLEDGEQLLGKKLWLLVKEINGPRTLSKRFVGKK